jgi:hypothetical protein
MWGCEEQSQAGYYDNSLSIAFVFYSTMQIVQRQWLIPASRLIA